MHTPAGWVAGIGTEQPQQVGKRLWDGVVSQAFGFETLLPCA